jgi:hypothetical protein
MARPAKRYEEFPKRIFGLKCSQHRAFKMRDVLGYYSKRVGKSTKKESLLKLLVKLEGEVNDAEQAAIHQWLVVKSTTNKQLIKLLNTAKGVAADPDEGGEWLQAPPPQFECSVCMESLDAENFPQQKITVLCNHEPTVCQACLTQSLDSQIPDVAWDQVRCPECSETLPYDVVKDWASPETFERCRVPDFTAELPKYFLTDMVDRYDQKSLLAAFRDMPNFAMCLGPGCDSGQIHETGDDQPIMTCTTCHFKTCFTHKMPWHSGQTCADYDAEQKKRMEQEAASEKWITETTKKCPNPECGHAIEKNGGCDHMTCKFSHLE